jgi:prevent-host-death family protein
VAARTTWPLHDAKNRFSRLVDDAVAKGPQTVTRHGEPVAVVVSIDTWRRVSRTQPTLKEYLTRWRLEGLDLTRDPLQRRDVDLP